MAAALDIVRVRGVSAAVATRCMLAVLSGCHTVRSVATHAGCHPSTAWQTLRGLSDAGLISGDIGQAGAYYPLVEVVACQPEMMR